MTQPATDINADILAAWSRFAAVAWEKWGDLPGGEQAMIDERALTTAIATTPAAIAAKLRYALYLNASPPWLVAAVLGADVPGLPERLSGDCAINESIWSAIQSLEAMEEQP